jgi:hypothetical protein
VDDDGISTNVGEEHGISDNDYTGANVSAMSMDVQQSLSTNYVNNTASTALGIK